MQIEKTKDFTIVRIQPKQLMEYLGISTQDHLFVSLSCNPQTEDIVLVTSNEEQK
jgi:hypothetical protein